VSRGAVDLHRTHDATPCTIDHWELKNNPTGWPIASGQRKDGLPYSAILGLPSEMNESQRILTERASGVASSSIYPTVLIDNRSPAWIAIVGRHQGHVSLAP